MHRMSKKCKRGKVKITLDVVRLNFIYILSNLTGRGYLKYSFSQIGLNAISAVKIVDKKERDKAEAAGRAGSTTGELMW